MFMTMSLSIFSSIPLLAILTIHPVSLDLAEEIAAEVEQAIPSMEEAPHPTPPPVAAAVAEAVAAAGVVVVAQVVGVIDALRRCR